MNIAIKHLLTVSFLFFLLIGQASGQKKFTLSGYIKSSENGESLIGATVVVPTLQLASTTNTYGFYSISIPEGEHEVQFSYLGFVTEIKKINLTANQKLTVALAPSSNQLQEVVIEAGSLKNKLLTTQMSVEQITAREAKLLPALFGEVDILKTLQLKPGIQSGGEGTSGLYVRGGGPDQNLIQLDEATVYNASHLFGFFSIFNPDAVKSIDLYKGGFPSQFGGRLSSIVDVKLKEGNNKNYSVNGGLGLIASRLTFEGPIIKDKSSFIVSGRRTYFDVFTRQINNANEGKKGYSPIPDYYFYDFNAKANYEIGEKDRVFISGYFGNDVFGFNDKTFDFNFSWGNKTGTARWNHIFNPKLFSNTSFTASSYNYKITNKFDQFKFDLSSDIRDFSLKTDFDYLPGNKHAYKFGAMAVQHRFGVGRLQAGNGGEIRFSSGTEYNAVEYGLYASDNFQVDNRLSLDYGLRVSGFVNQGKNYNGFEPRMSARYSLTDRVSIKGSYARMLQYVHLVSNSGASLPTDIWFPSTKLVKPQRSNQVALGLSKLIGEGQFLITNEVYYKWMNNQVDFRDGAQLFVNDNLEKEFLFGKGTSYGNEIYLEKKKGKTTGWIGYTLSWTWREFSEINNGKKFPTRYDRRHDISVVLMHELSKKISLTGTWVYGTGNATTLPIGRFAMQDIPGSSPTIIPVYPAERNSFRMAPYNRMDLGMVYQLNPKRGESDLTFSIYNVYNRRNPYFIYYEEVKDDNNNSTLQFRAKQVSLFPIIPSITYNFKF